jgi:hypothetical protein
MEEHARLGGVSVHTFTHYHNEPGVYYYPNAEGEYEIYDRNGVNWICNKPRQNATAYTHPMLDLPYMTEPKSFTQRGVLYSLISTH